MQKKNKQKKKQIKRKFTVMQIIQNWYKASECQLKGGYQVRNTLLQSTKKLQKNQCNYRRNKQQHIGTVATSNSAYKEIQGGVLPASMLAFNMNEETWN